MPAWRFPLDRFIEKIRLDSETTCWTWMGHVNASGYGMFRLNGVMINAHRAAVVLYGGELLPGKECDHLCRNTKCVNPAHIEQVTHAVNNERSNSPSANNARKDTCPRCGSAFARRADKSRTCVGCQRRRSSVNLRNRYHSDPEFKRRKNAVRVENQRKSRARLREVKEIEG